ncbi:MAG: hypothetical protein CL965_04600 [Euryarchaeota archaeon]|nr:hypothetical protein [Euryarchaeota archaeon]
MKSTLVGGMKMDKFLETWINETIGKEEVAGEYERISLRAILYAAIANYRAPAWVQSPLRGL